MAEFEAVVQKIGKWKNGQGCFISFEGVPGHFWMRGILFMQEGTRVKVKTKTEQFADRADSQLITSIVEIDNNEQQRIGELPRQKSVLPGLAESTGATVVGGVERLPAYTQKLDYDSALMKQAIAIRELQAALGKVQARVDELERKASCEAFESGAKPAMSDSWSE